MTYQALNTPYQGTVLRLEDTGKEFMGGGVNKRKFMITLDGGYMAEFCPPALQKPNFKEGDVITFKIVYRTAKGDEIEVISKEGGGVPIKQSTLSTNSMVGHPAVVALTVAKDMAIQNGWDWEQMINHAELAMQWLVERKDLDSYSL